MNDTMFARRAAPIAAVVITVMAASLATWAAVTPGSGATAPVVTTADLPAATSTSAAATAGAPTTTAVPVTTSAVPFTTTTPTTTTEALGATAVAPTTTTAAPVITAVAPARSSDEVVLATLGQGTIEAWTPEGRVGSAGPCAGELACLVLASAWADGAVVSAVAVRDGSSSRTSLVRSPLDGGAPQVLADLDAQAWVGAVAIVGADVWWLEQPSDGTVGGRVRRMPLGASLGVATEVAHGVEVFAPRPDGGAVALRRSGLPGPDGPELTVVDLASGQERSVSLGSGMSWSSAIMWLDNVRLFVQGPDGAVVVDAGPDLRVVRDLPFIVACVETSSRVIGVVRTTGTRADQPLMRHTLAEADPSTGRVTAWAGGDLSDGMIACRGDGAVLTVSFTAEGIGTEMAAVRASGRRTVLGRGYVSVAGRRGAGGFSSMNCGPARDGGSGPL